MINLGQRDEPWTQQFNALQPFLQDRSGAVGIRVYPGSASNTFKKLIRNQLSRHHIIDVYAEDDFRATQDTLITRLATILNVELPEPGAANVEIGKDIRAGHNVTIEKSTVIVELTAGYFVAHRLRALRTEIPRRRPDGRREAHPVVPG